MNLGETSMIVGLDGISKGIILQQNVDLVRSVKCIIIKIVLKGQNTSSLTIKE